MPVDEKTGRAAVEATVKATVTLQRELGAAVPDQTAAEAWARPIVEEQIRKTEEAETRRYLIPPTPATPGEPKARIDRGDVGDNTTPIVRDISAATLDKRTGLLKCDDPHGRFRVEKPREDKLLRKRLDFLGQFPEWKAKLEKAVWDGEALARSRDHVVTVKEKMSIIADRVIEVVETSNAIFGDWRHPPPPSGPTLFVH
jgi:hypothetical protein